MKNQRKNWIKFTLTFVVCLVIRLIPRPPNIEPILASSMPFSKAYGAGMGFLFAILSIVSYDLLTSTLGIWTLFTALSYGLVAILASFYLKNKENKSINYVKFAIFGTILYDALTGLLVGPLFFGQTFAVALAGQIPFTIMHLAGNILFATILSPALFKYILREEAKLPIISFNYKNI